MKTHKRWFLAALILMAATLLLSVYLPGEISRKKSSYKCFYGDVDYAAVLR